MTRVSGQPVGRIPKPEGLAVSLLSGACPTDGGNDQRSPRGACDARARLRRGRRRRRPRLRPRGQRVRPRPRRARARRAPCPRRSDIRGDGAPGPGARHRPRRARGRAEPHRRRRRRGRRPAESHQGLRRGVREGTDRRRGVPAADHPRDLRQAGRDARRSWSAPGGGHTVRATALPAAARGPRVEARAADVRGASLRNRQLQRDHRLRGGPARGCGGPPASDPRDPRRHRHGPLPRHRRHGPRVGRRNRSRAPPEEVALSAETASFRLPPDLEAAVSAELDAWRAGDKVKRLWAGDATLWTGADEASWLGWLGVVRDQLARVDALRGLAAEVGAAGFTHALVLGMGGSSLCPEVLKMTFGRIAGHPELFVLDSTDPGQIRAIERQIDVATTLFIVSSKSGSTLEPNIFMWYFFDRAKALVGGDRAGSRFITITDPGSRMQEVATADGFRRILFGVPSIGGRYSALSDFGMAPAAIRSAGPT